MTRPRPPHCGHVITWRTISGPCRLATARWPIPPQPGQRRGVAPGRDPLLAHRGHGPGRRIVTSCVPAGQHLLQGDDQVQVHVFAARRARRGRPEQPLEQASEFGRS